MLDVAVNAALPYTRKFSRPASHCRRFAMTREEALKELDQLSRAVKSGPVSQREVLCQEMREAARILSVAFERLRKREPLYGNIRRSGFYHRRPGVCRPPDGAGCCGRDLQTFARMPGPVLSWGRSEELPAGSHFASDGDRGFAGLAGCPRGRTPMTHPRASNGTFRQARH
jgi:hypothetical protein